MKYKRFLRHVARMRTYNILYVVYARPGIGWSLLNREINTDDDMAVQWKEDFETARPPLNRRWTRMGETLKRRAVLDRLYVISS